ncbi:hypothetical protein D3C79_936810 [compost metagenome]
MASVAITRGLAAAWPAVARAISIMAVLSFMVSPLQLWCLWRHADSHELCRLAGPTGILRWLRAGSWPRTLRWAARSRVAMAMP